MEYLFNTTFYVANPLVEKFLDWVRNDYERALRERGEGEGMLLCRLLVEEPEGCTGYAVQYRTCDIPASTRELEKSLERLFGEVQRESVLYFSTAMEII